MRSLLGGTWEATSTHTLAATTWGMPLPVPILLALGLAGHLADRLKANRVVERLAGSGDWLRGFGYAAAVVMLVTLSPGVGKSFIYIAF